VQVVRGTTSGKRFFLTLKVPMQCPFILLVEGKALGSEQGKGSGCRLCYEQRRKVEPGLCII
jgi:hypothetical protein